MKKLLFVLALLVSYSATAQVQDSSLLAGKYSFSQSGGGSGYWQASGNFTDESGLFEASNIQVGDLLCFTDAGVGYYLPITEVVSATHPSITIKVANTGITNISMLPTTLGAICRPSATISAPMYVSGLTTPDLQTILGYLNKKVTSELGEVGWGKLTNPVKDSIRGRKDTTVLVLSESKVVDFDFADTRRYSNVYFIGKGVTDTAQLIFLNPPVPEQFGTVFHMKADSGGVAVRFAGSQGVNNKFFYMLRTGQRAEVRALYDAVAGLELWAVNVVWDSIGGAAKTIYNSSDSLKSPITYAKMQTTGTTQSLIFGNLANESSFNYTTDYGIRVKSNSSIDMVMKGSYNVLGTASSDIGARNAYFNGTSVLNSLYMGYNYFRDPRNLNTVNTLGAYFGASAMQRSYIEGGHALYWNKTGYTAGIKSFVDTIGNNAASFLFSRIGGDTVDYAFNGKFQDLPGLLNYNNGISFLGISKNGINIIMPNISKRFSINRYTSGVHTNLFMVDYQKYLGNAIRMYDKYDLVNAVPSPTSGAISTHIWTGTTPSFLRSQHAVITGTTDGNGDITITFPAAMPDASYTVLITGEGGTLYHYMTQPATKATASVKVRMFTIAGSAAASTAYQISYEVKDN